MKKRICFLLAFVLLATSLFTLNQAKDIKGSEKQDKEKKTFERVVSNRLVIKLKDEAATKLKNQKNINPKNTNVKSLDKLNSKYGVKGVKGHNKNKKENNSEFFTLSLPFEEFSVDMKGNESRVDKSGFVISPKELKKIEEEYENDPNVESAEFSKVVNLSTVPNDPFFLSSNTWGQGHDDLWGLKKIKAAEAWSTNTGSSNVVVAVVDTGIDFTHPDLTSNIWNNLGEVGSGKETNGVDDDGNGFIDDWRGYDFSTYAGKASDNNPSDGEGHGTHVSGTVAAVGNNGVGVVGISWASKIMPVKGLSDSGYGYDDDLADAIIYAADNGADIINNSWGGAGSSAIITDALDHAYNTRGVLLVAAAGNENNDAAYYTPASDPNVITVSATNYLDNKAAFSNYGTKIDVAAPGGDSAYWGGRDDHILSTRSASSDWGAIATNYAIARGTSMASPHVAGLAALILSKNPGWSNNQIREAIKSSADDIGSPGQDDYYGHGRINAERALQIEDIPSFTFASPAELQDVSGTISITGTASGLNFANFHLEHSLDRLSWTTITNSTTPVTDGILGTLETLSLSEGVRYIRLTVSDTEGNVYVTTRRVVVDNIIVNISSPNNTLFRSPTTVDINGSAGVNAGAFASYKIEVSAGMIPNYSNTGISLVGNGSGAISADVLGSWNQAGLSSDNYYIKLTVTAASGITDVVETAVNLDFEVLENWPITESNEISTVASGDVDGDGENEIVYGTGANTSNGILYVRNKDGSLLPGWPKTITPPNGNVVGILLNMAFPTVEDINNDGKEDIIVFVHGPHFGGTPGSQDARVFVFNYDGTQIPGWPQTIQEYIARTAPAVGDIDNDGSKEIIIKGDLSSPDNRTNLYIFRSNGESYPGWPKKMGTATQDYEGGCVGSSPVITDFEGDGQKEILVGEYDGKVYAFRPNGDSVSGWPVSYSDGPIFGQGITNIGSVRATPAVGDINGDNQLEVVVGIGSVNGHYAYYYAWNKNGSVVGGWPKYMGIRKMWSSVSLADLDGNGDLEITAQTGDYISQDYFRWNHDGTNFAEPLSGAGNGYASPLPNDVNADGKIDTIFRQGGLLSAFNQSNDKVWSKYSYTDYVYQSPSITDIDNNQDLELIAAFGDKIWVWDIAKSTIDGQVGWPTFQGNNQRTGFYPVASTYTPPPAPTLVPVYRFFNMRNGSHFYTASLGERNNVIARYSRTYRYEGVAYQAYASGLPLYRFFNMRNGSHFYTASLGERDSVIARLSRTYRYEGIAYYVANSGTPVYRFFNMRNGSHFYTASLGERNNVIARYSRTYRYEGVGFFVY